jgi:SAM-dependent methyltransferase
MGTTGEGGGLPPGLLQRDRVKVVRVVKRSPFGRLWPPRRVARLGALRRRKPISDRFGFDRGRPVDRYYIEAFLARHGGPSGDIRGHVLEVGDDGYIRAFGAGVEKVDVLSYDATPQATIVDDLATGANLPSNTFDCVICTQTLLYVYDIRAAIATLARILKPGRTLLATMPGISRICPPDWSDYWRLTSASARRLFEEGFPGGKVHVEAHGNVLSAAAFLYGLAVEDLRPADLDYRDQAFEVTVAVRAVKAS